MEDVNNEIHEVQQYPPSLLNTLDVMHPYTFFLQFGDEMLADCSNVRVGRSARNDEIVGHVSYAAKIQEDHIIRFHVETDRGGAHCGRSGLACGGGCSR